MWTILKNRILQGHRTSSYPKGPVELPERFRGLPVLDASKCPDGCRSCVDRCPTEAIRNDPLRLDLGACLFCPVCEEACSAEAVRFSRDHRLSVRHREDLWVGPEAIRLADAMKEETLRLFGRSLKLRQVSAGGCNGCEAELNVLGINVFDLGRFGIQFVASPRHADGVVVTGPVTANMRNALAETYEAIPSPKLVIAVGACALSGGPFRQREIGLEGVADRLPVDLFIPGCPPHPYTLLDGLLRLLGKI